MQPTPYPEVNRLLEELLACVQRVLGERLVGLYLYGSLTTGDFDLDISDIDLLAALASDLGDSEAEALREMHSGLARDYTAWDDRVEVAYLSVEGLRTFRSQRSALAVISPGEPFHVIDAGEEWLMNWYLVREKGVALFGPSADTLIAPITAEEFAECVRGYAFEWSERVKAVKTRKEQAHAVLTMCRALYVLRVGEHASKRRAALWAQGELPDWADLIGRALEWRAAWREEADHEATRDETLRFVEHVRGLLG